jgi:hypothetical protein
VDYNSAKDSVKTRPKSLVFLCPGFGDTESDWNRSIALVLGIPHI